MVLSSSCANPSKLVLKITFGALPNHHCLLQSLDFYYPASNSYEDNVQVIHSPAAGAYSYHNGRIFASKRDMVAGEEIYLDYGHCERDEENPDEWYNFIPMPSDYEEAASIVRRDMLAVLERGEEPLLEQGTRAVSDIVRRMLPRTIEEVQFYNRTFVPEGSHSLAFGLAMHGAAEPRTPEWIRENGVCVENLVPGPSSVPMAGRGAIAQHAIAAGDVVVPVPMLQVLDRSALRMYDEEDNFVLEQLLLNYCFGHADSTMLLCPMTNAALINHDSQQPNAEIQWHDSSEALFNTTIDELWSGLGRGLRMDVVALRDIEVGEEVFIDYGPAWESAWQAHVEHSQIEHHYDEERMSTNELNSQDKIPDAFLAQDLRENRFDLNVMTGCQYAVSDNEASDSYQEENDGWRDLPDDEILRLYSTVEDGRLTEKYEYHDDKSYWPCTIIREQDDGNYLVRIYQHRDNTVTPWAENGLPRFITDYPRSSIHFFPYPYESDQWLAGAFRHHIGIPDHLFMNAWKNLSH